jgi:hypothetical protein
MVGAILDRGTAHYKGAAHLSSHHPDRVESPKSPRCCWLVLFPIPRNVVANGEYSDYDFGNS